VLFQDYEHQSAFQNQDVQVSMRSFPLQTWVPQSQGGSPQRSFTSNLYPQIDSLVGVMEMPKAKAGEGYSNWIYNYDYAAYKLPSICPPLIKKMQTLSLINCMWILLQNVILFCFLQFFEIWKFFFLLCNSFFSSEASSFFTFARINYPIKYNTLLSLDAVQLTPFKGHPYV